jgi:hypothetical protein
MGSVACCFTNKLALYIFCDKRVYNPYVAKNVNKILNGIKLWEIITKCRPRKADKNKHRTSSVCAGHHQSDAFDFSAVIRIKGIDDAAVEHHGQAVGERKRFGQITGDQQNAGPFPRF